MKDDINMHEEGILSLETILDKEHEELTQSKRQHHSDWDNHILTLSTASLGFTFTFLPVTSGEYFYLLLIGVILFITSICSAAYNYVVADNGMKHAMESLIKRRVFSTKLKQSFYKVQQISQNPGKYTKAQAGNAKKDYFSNVTELLNDDTLNKGVDKTNKINKTIGLLNHAKTYAFLLGIICIVLYSLLNVALLGK